MKKIASETAARIIGSIANGLFWTAKKIMKIESPSKPFENVKWNGFSIDFDDSGFKNHSLDDITEVKFENVKEGEGWFINLSGDVTTLKKKGNDNE